MIEAMVAGMEASGETFEGCYVPDRAMLCAAQAIAQQTYPQVIEAIRQLSGGGLIMLPSSQADLMEPATLEIVMNSQMSPAMGSLDRVKLFKLAWDAVGSEFGLRWSIFIGLFGYLWAALHFLLAWKTLRRDWVG